MQKSSWESSSSALALQTPLGEVVLLASGQEIPEDLSSVYRQRVSVSLPRNQSYPSTQAEEMFWEGCMKASLPLQTNRRSYMMVLRDYVG